MGQGQASPQTPVWLRAGFSHFQHAREAKSQLWDHTCCFSTQKQGQACSSPV